MSKRRKSKKIMTLIQEVYGSLLAFGEVEIDRRESLTLRTADPASATEAAFEFISGCPVDGIQVVRKPGARK